MDGIALIKIPKNTESGENFPSRFGIQAVSRLHARRGIYNNCPANFRNVTVYITRPGRGQGEVGSSVAWHIILG